MLFKKRKPPVDICLIVEGSYPYIKGGVASWIHQILENYPDFTFDIVVLVASDKDEYKLQYEIPKNVNKIHHIYIRKSFKKPIFSIKKFSQFKNVESFISNFFSFKEYEKGISKILKLSKRDKNKFMKEALYSEDVFTYINEFYENSSFKSKSYIDFF